MSSIDGVDGDDHFVPEAVVTPDGQVYLSAADVAHYLRLCGCPDLAEEMEVCIGLVRLDMELQTLSTGAPNDDTPGGDETLLRQS